ncbi:unnamed protein product [Rotaria sp. Silwood1]|nr:unnamed protein product [Rotaria sp. Silwood1]
MSTNVITKKNSTTSTTNTSNTTYLSMMTPNVSSTNVTNTSTNKRREGSTGEDSGVQIDHDSIIKNAHLSITNSSNIVPSLLLSSSSSSSSSLTSKTIGTTTAPNPNSVTTFSSNSTMVTSSTLIPPSVDTKTSSLLPRKTSNASSSGTFSEVSRSFGHEENSADSLYGLTSSSSSSHYIIKCTLNTTTTTPTITNTNTSSMSTTLPTLSPPVILTPRVKVTVQQPSITTSSSRIDSSAESIPSSSFLKTPTSNILPILSPSSHTTTSAASSAPEFSISGTSSIDDSEELALYEQYLSISYGRQSNPSPEIRKITVDDVTKIQQRTLPRSKSEANTLPIEQSQSQQQQQPQQRQQQQTTTSQIKPVSKFSSYDLTFC